MSQLRLSVTIGYKFSVNIIRHLIIIFLGFMRYSQCFCFPLDTRPNTNFNRVDLVLSMSFLCQQAHSVSKYDFFGFIIMYPD